MNKNFPDAVFFSKPIIKKEHSVTIYMNRRFVFNSAFWLLLKDKSYVKLLYSATKKSIIFQFTNDNQEGCSIKLSKEPVNKVVCAVSTGFFKKFNIKLDGTVRLKPENYIDDELGDIWVVNLTGLLAG